MPDRRLDGLPKTIAEWTAAALDSMRIDRTEKPPFLHGGFSLSLEGDGGIL